MNNTSGKEDRADERNRLRLALLLTVIILIAEAIGGYLTGSLALISDASHMLTDSASLILSLLALQIATTLKNDKYTFGFKRIEILAALLNGILLLFICAYIVYEGVQRFLHPTAINVGTMLIIAVIGLVTNLTCAVILSKSHNLNVRSAFLHVVGDLLSSVGVVLGGIVMMIWNVMWVDPALSFVIAALVLVSGYRVIREATGVLMEAAPEGVDVGLIRETLKGNKSIADVHDLHVWTITSGLPALSCHIVRDKNTTKRNDQILEEIGKVLRQEFGIDHSTIQIETSEFIETADVCTTCD